MSSPAFDRDNNSSPKAPAKQNENLVDVKATNDSVLKQRFLGSANRCWQEFVKCKTDVQSAQLAVNFMFNALICEPNDQQTINLLFNYKNVGGSVFIKLDTAGLNSTIQRSEHETDVKNFLYELATSLKSDRSLSISFSACAKTAALANFKHLACYLAVAAVQIVSAENDDEANHLKESLSIIIENHNYLPFKKEETAQRLHSLAEKLSKSMMRTSLRDELKQISAIAAVVNVIQSDQEDQTSAVKKNPYDNERENNLKRVKKAFDAQPANEEYLGALLKLLNNPKKAEDFDIFIDIYQKHNKAKPSASCEQKILEYQLRKDELKLSVQLLKQVNGKTSPDFDAQILALKEKIKSERYALLDLKIKASPNHSEEATIEKIRLLIEDQRYEEALPIVQYSLKEINLKNNQLVELQHTLGILFNVKSQESPIYLELAKRSFEMAMGDLPKLKSDEKYPGEKQLKIDYANSLILLNNIQSKPELLEQARSILLDLALLNSDDPRLLELLNLSLGQKTGALPLSNAES